MSGFDLELVETVAEPPTGKSVILYAGTLYERFDLEPLYRGLATERAAGTITPETLGLRFVGRLNDRVLVEANAHGVADFFAVSGPVVRAEILSLMSKATALLLPLYEEDPYSLPMKFYEYVGAGRPIVALGPPDRFAARLVEEHALGAVLSSAEDVGTLLKRLALDPNALAAPTRAAREQFTWKHTAATLEDVLERAVSTRARG
jgi:glycosyltransferase involved in cell wall biosynthesis